ncbi:helix-turn-helix transcriptional regulator [Flavobacterium aquidurense]|uniref:helix-turn-helix transcriptional regulator n=1 Tax=Flavobacterium aquidurense TaxID=362413 RepID=UPI002858D881|nr:helix-turn-helix transcriptional regulator [Flavobacterium aquidurense]MDR7369741.1 transcriptional regulator with XRE-family HTH domain [Flavobacterium aquidurense]
MNVIVGNKLKKLRNQRGLTQKQMANLLAISQSAYARIENGESGSWAGHIKKICKIFDILPQELVKDDN